ncbi:MULTISPECIES: TIGR02530 family flagellar biosynthesis protein [Cytobacillus]|uniref:Flagellar protein n=1 Tax=Cytobacillus oceanisediminis TaxID=665099 RepID=A0ABX3CW51_9BACI|nr:TIGR02530 family flagellar biosynthesis protein [Cytobacillus oceanisediminis]MBU8768584.1 flagellar protein [Cytobacillus oceanisediminis]MCM3400793.1 flagellar protein [Cytobacillus oceanisediminis]MDK7665060.1 TIGR02530 family flagellar biosynthesis protein [Cytobacillus oceanisediminis]OHX49531.1 flagellar protein [Cytobacillus oceanisediminis]
MDKLIFRPIHTQPVITPKGNAVQTSKQSHNKFSDHLQTALQTEGDLIVSKHAKQRLEQRGIHISAERWKQIEEKVKEAKAMGVKESLVLLDNAALVVSAKNNTVITAMDRKETRTQIFTNIDGTIILDQ